MKSFMVVFSGLKHGWVGKRDTYTLTVKAESEKEVAYSLARTYQVDKVLKVRELKVKSL